MMAASGKARRNANGQGGVYRRADGRWEAKVFVDTPDGRRKRISVYGDSERAALDELGKVRDQQRRGMPIATTTLTVAEYMTLLARTRRRAQHSAHDVRYVRG
jgi:hypothetical protein